MVNPIVIIITKRLKGRRRSIDARHDNYNRTLSYSIFTSLDSLHDRRDRAGDEISAVKRKFRSFQRATRLYAMFRDRARARARARGALNDTRDDRFILAPPFARNTARWTVAVRPAERREGGREGGGEGGKRITRGALSAILRNIGGLKSGSRVSRLRPKPRPLRLGASRG